MREINPINNNGSILLRFTVAGKQYSFAPIKGADYKNKKHLAKVKAIANKIKLDIEAEEFDQTLVKYGYRAKVKPPLKSLDLKDLWLKYRVFKSAFLASSTIKIDYDRRVGNCLDDLPTLELNKAIEIRNWLITNKPLPQAKRILTHLNACCDWGIESGLITFNPFQNMNRKLKIKKDEEDINPFTLEERDKIIKAFEQSQDYSYYTNLVKFIFYTGCRPCEALALEWSEVKPDSIIFNKSYVEGEKQGRLKTQKQRRININEKVKTVIRDIPKRLSIVFPSPITGDYINWNNFCSRAWKKTLSSLPEIEYRNPYQMRHTSITAAIQAGVPVTDIGKHHGNSAKTIYQNYAGYTRDFVMPPL